MTSSLSRDDRRDSTNDRIQGKYQLPEHRYHVSTQKHSSHSSRWHSREASFHTVSDRSRNHTRHESEASQELEFSPGHGPTRDSMVEGMLQSLNGLPDAEGPVASLEPYETSFPNGEFKPSFDIKVHRRDRSPHGPSLSSSAQTLPLAAVQNPKSTNFTATREAHSRRATASSIKSRFNVTSQSHFNEERREFARPATEAGKRELHAARCNSFENTRSGQNLKQRDMDYARNIKHRDTSPSADYDLNPHDHQSRRRSRTYNSSTSVLNRSRPVPPEYHVFDDGVKSVESTRDALHRSTTYPNPLDRAPETLSLPKSRMTNENDSRRGSEAGITESASTEPHDSIDSSGNNRGVSAPRIPHTDSFTSTSSRGLQDSSTNIKLKDKTGFLKRMFGSSKTSSTSDLKQQMPQVPPVQVESKRDANHHDAVTTQVAPKSSSTPKALPIPQTYPGKQHPPQQLRQKTSFFRRRRKTLTEKDMSYLGKEQSPPPPHGGVPVAGSDRPSTSSLRQVMHPYLGESAPRRKRSEVETDPESVEDVPMRRGAEKESAYDFLRSTSPGSAGFMKKGPKRSLNDHSRRASTTSSNKEHRSRPSTSARDSRRVNETAIEERGRQLENIDATQRNEDRPTLHADGRRRSATSPSEMPHKSREAESTPQVPKVPKIETSPNGRPVAGHPLTAPAEADSTKRRDKDSWLLLASTKADRESEGRGSSSRVWVQPVDSSDENLTKSNEPYVGSTSPNKQALTSDKLSAPDDFNSARSDTSMAAAPLEDLEDDPISPLPTDKDFPAPSSPAPLPLSEVEQAKRIFDARNEPKVRAQGALRLGEAGAAADRLRAAFMNHFDFAGLNILLALRDLCARMTLKGETQQMDRIMAAFSKRWCECNPNHGFRSEDVVHTICYSLLLLNTDLHVADLTDKMTRNQFVKNTIPTLRRVAEADTYSTADSTIRISRNQARGALPFQEERSNSVADSDNRLSADDRGGASRLSNKHSLRPTSEIPSVASPGPYDHPVDPSELLVNNPHEGTNKSWEAALETVLKEFYLSIRQLCLPLHGAEEAALHEQPSSNSLSVMTNIMRRTGSVISKTTSEDSRGRPSTFRSAASRFTSKNRSRPRLYPTSTLGSSRTASRTSLEDGNMWSPSASSINSQGKTPTTMSTESLGARFSPSEQGYQQSIGFANALSHVIIREEGTGPTDDSATDGEVPLLENESLELTGAPWAKEGILQHKHHLEMEGKKARDRNWSECFAVIQRGHMRLFSFHGKSSKGQPKNKLAAKAGTVVGGGNWLESAESIATFTLRHTIANALPPPGYSKQRPHVFALSLPTGAVHLFHVGTAEIAQEFVMTANYWSARLSKEPLVGGVSNIEYGWGESVINIAIVGSPTTSEAPSITGNKSNSTGPPSSFHLPVDASAALTSTGGRTSSSGGRSLHSPTPSGSISIHNSSGLSSDRAGGSGRPSITGSLRSSFDAPRPAAMRNRLPADRVVLGSWQPPQQSLMPSRLPEAEQLTALKAYVSSIEEELVRHNELRPGLVLAFSPRSVNATKAMGNWERKSHYLLREIVKFRTYVDVLEVAEQRRQEVRGGIVQGDERGVSEKVGKIREVEKEAEEDLELSEETMEALRFTRARRVGTGDTETSSRR